MVALRYSNSSTSDNVRALCDIIRDPKCERVTLFGTVKEVSALVSNLRICR